MSITYATTSFGTQLPHSTSQHSLVGSPGGRSSRQSFHSLNTYQNSIASQSSYGIATTTGEHEPPANFVDLETSDRLPEVYQPQPHVAISSSTETEAQKEARLLAERETMDGALSQFFGGVRRKSTRVPVPVLTEAEELEAEAAATPTRPSRISFSDPPPVAVVPTQYDVIGTLFRFGRRSSSAPHPAPSLSEENSAPQTEVNNGAVPSYGSDARSMIDTESLPSYSKVEVRSLFPFNRKMFFYGFFFPPFWLLGMIMPFITPSFPDARIDGRPQEEKEAELTQLRIFEFRWALRCAAALLALILFGAVAAILAIILTRRK